MLFVITLYQSTERGLIVSCQCSREFESTSSTSCTPLAFNANVQSWWKHKFNQWKNWRRPPPEKKIVSKCAHFSITHQPITYHICMHSYTLREGREICQKGPLHHFFPCVGFSFFFVPCVAHNQQFHYSEKSRNSSYKSNNNIIHVSGE